MTAAAGFRTTGEPPHTPSNKSTAIICRHGQSEDGVNTQVWPTGRQEDRRFWFSINACKDLRAIGNNSTANRGRRREIVDFVSC